tara:strand:+ start:2316 stop:3374 length:1059 start_codon:yes stop_codon:yes gene_type:complete
MSFNRIYWAIQALGISAEGSDGDTYGTDKAAIASSNFVSGVQSVGITTSFNLEQVFELGQLSLYEDVEEVPDVEVTIERVIDNHKLLYSRCAGDTTVDGVSISNMQNNKVDLWFSLTTDQEDDAGDANPNHVVWMSGMYMSSASFTFPTDGNLTESVTMVGNHKVWFDSPGAKITGAPTGTSGGTGTVQRRQNVRIYTPSGSTSISNDIQGDTASAITAKITSVSVSVDFGREEINVLGQKLPYYRYVTYPVEVTTEVEVLARGTENVNAKPEAANVSERAVKFYIEPRGASSGDTPDTNNTIALVDVGAKNKLTSVTWGGGDTGGANATITYSYRNFNDLTVRSFKSTYYD